MASPADRKLQKAGSIVDELLRAWWEEIHDAGPDDFEGGTIDWNKVLQGDRFFALLEIRAFTYGAEYSHRLALEPVQGRVRQAYIELQKTTATSCALAGLTRTCRVAPGWKAASWSWGTRAVTCAW